MYDLLNRHGLTDEEFERLAPLMPAHPRQGHRWNDHCIVINGILFRTRTGCPWRDLPPGFGNLSTVYGRHRRWSLDGTWAKILDVLRAGCDAAEGREWTVSADSTVVRAHQHAGGARRALPPELARGALANDNNAQATGTNPAKPGRGREALGRSRGGLTTKIHLAADRRCRPLARILTPGQHGDCPQFIPLMNQLQIRRRGAGRPRTRPGAAMGDKAYSSAANRAYLRKREIKAVIPVKEDQKNNRRARGRRGGRPPAFDQACYRDRNTVERCFSKLKQFRAVATRYDKRKEIYQGTVDVASIRIWLRDPPHDLQNTLG